MKTIKTFCVVILITLSTIFLTACNESDPTILKVNVSANDFTVNHTRTNNIITINVDTMFVVNDVIFIIMFSNDNNVTHTHTITPEAFPFSQNFDLANQGITNITSYRIAFIGGTISIKNDGDLFRIGLPTQTPSFEI